MAINFKYPVIDFNKTGENITRLRKENGYSVKDLKDYCMLESVQSVYKWQNGESLPAQENLLVLSYLFGVTINEILIYSGCDGSRICRFFRLNNTNGHFAALAA